MAISKKTRELVFSKYSGKCAYCGDPLQKGWHVDHLLPIERGRDWDPAKRKWVVAGMSFPERDCFENYMPACASCNINKHSGSLENFRSLIENFIESLNKYSVQYKIAKRYGLVSEVKKPVMFYFETLAADQVA